MRLIVATNNGGIFLCLAIQVSIGRRRAARFHSDQWFYGEWIGTLDGLVNADIKAQVSGYLLKQDYTEGC
jgi:hypothetical protein